jgi:hypothetical protein
MVKADGAWAAQLIGLVKFSQRDSLICHWVKGQILAKEMICMLPSQVPDHWHSSEVKVEVRI